MRQTDIAIIGGGLAGSTAAAMLGRAGIDAVLIDPHEAYPPDFRCEKLDASQIAILRRTGLADKVLTATARGSRDWIARYGRVVETRQSDQHGVRYDDLVNRVRAEIPPSVAMLRDKAAAIANTSDRQVVTLAGGDQVSARLIVLANGLNSALRRNFGMERNDLSPAHSITIGFDMTPAGRPAFPFGALAYYPEKIGRLCYLTLFPVPGAMRANLIVYRDMKDPWLRRMRDTPEAALAEEMPGLERLTGAFTVVGPVKIRPADLYRTTNTLQPGVVLVGDAFGTSCPGAGTGTTKVFTDVERLCNVHIPRWLASDGMGLDKIAAFYDDPVKRAADRASLAKAFRLRSLSVDRSPYWTAMRIARLTVQIARATLRRVRGGERQSALGTGQIGHLPDHRKTPEIA